MPVCGIHSGTGTRPWETSWVMNENHSMSQAYQVKNPARKTPAAKHATSSPRRAMPRVRCRRSVMRMCSPARSAWASPRKEDAAMQYPANSSKLCAAKPSRRPPICASDSKAIATKKNPASRPEVRYRSSSAARTRRLPSARERLEDRLALEARLLRPLVGDLPADFREFGREPGRGLHDLDALVHHVLRQERLRVVVVRQIVPGLGVHAGRAGGDHRIHQSRAERLRDLRHLHGRRY